MKAGSPLWDYGFNEEVEDGFNSSEACGEQAHANEEKKGRNLDVIYGTTGVLPHFFCRQATKRDLDELALQSMLRERAGTAR